jgi:mono/diheme cytochrome c family protein
MARILTKIALAVVLFILGFVGIGLYLFHNPSTPPLVDITFPTSSELIARGEYLVNGPAHCSNCHGDPAKRDEMLRGEVIPLTGGEHIELPIADLYPPNLTPDKATGIGAYSDAELLRVMRHNVGRDGHPLMPFMPFEEIAQDDLFAIIAYLRSLEPVSHPTPPHSFSLVGKLVRGYLIKARGPTTEPPQSMQSAPTVEYGEYLAYKIANCHGCHTNRSLASGEFTGAAFEGGLELPAIGDPGRTVVSPDITKDGIIADWDVQHFLARFRQRENVPGTHMPWGAFSRMTDQDLTAIYNYLQTR